MRLLLVSNYYPEHVGGIESVAAGLARAYRARGLEVRWVAADVPERPHASEPGDVPLRAWNVAERRFGFPYPLPWPGSMRELVREARRADALHVHDCLYAASALACATAARLEKPVLLTQHVAEVPYSSRALRLLQGAAYGTLGRAVLERADQVAFVSQAVMRRFEGSVRFRRPPVLVENGVDSGRFRPAPPEERERLRARLGVPTGSPLLLFVGRFVEKKGVGLLREAARARPGWSWLLVGRDGDESPRSWGLPNLRALEPLSGAGLRDCYAAADLLVLPSVGEGFPVVVQEAMACGTPAVVSRDTAAAVPEAAGLLHGSAREPAALLAAIERALREAGPEARTRAAAFARRRWSADTAAERYLDLLAELTGERKAA